MTGRSVPTTTEEEAEAFLDQDLSGLDLSQFRPLDRERLPKTARITMRVPQPPVDTLKAKARDHGIPCQRPVREAIEKAV
jgi:predicted DNA binding CopG/RHH family protein